MYIVLSSVLRGQGRLPRLNQPFHAVVLWVSAVVKRILQMNTFTTAFNTDACLYINVNSSFCLVTLLHFILNDSESL
jgi:hypothetical protein